MKKKLPALVAFTLWLGFPHIAQAENSMSVGLTLPPHFAADTCKVPPWKNLVVVWKGIEDKRVQKEIGTLTVRGKNPAQVLASPQLKTVVEEGVKDLLTSCGMKLVDQGDDKSLKLSMNIEEFYAQFDKKIISSQSNAKSRLSFVIEGPHDKKTVDVGFTLENKNVRKPGNGPLEDTLNELYRRTLEQIPINRQMQNLQGK